MATTFHDLGSLAGLKKLDDYLLTRSYITGYQASKDDVTVHVALLQPPSAEFVNVSRWYNHIEALLSISIDLYAAGVPPVMVLPYLLGGQSLEMKEDCLL